MSTSKRHIETIYGPMPGCPDCGVIAFNGVHLCEHGVTPATEVEITLEAPLDRATYKAWVHSVYGEEP